MNIKGIVGTVAALLLVCGMVSGSAFAQEKKPLLVKLAIINVEKIQGQATALKQLRAQLEKYGAAYKAEIQKEEQELRKANMDLARKRAVMSPEAFEEERKKFEQRFIQVQRKVQERRRSLDRAGREAKNTVQKSLNESIAEVAKENALTLILRHDQVVFWATDFDITALVLDRLNKKMPSVTVRDPGTL